MGWVSGIVCLGFFGCNRPGTADVKGSLQVGTCATLKQPTDWSLEVGFMNLQFQGTHKEAAVVELRLQAHPGSPTHRNPSPQDILLVEIHKPSLIKTNKAIRIIKFKPSLSAQTPSNNTKEPSARAALQLGKSCPKKPLPFAVEGSLTFTKFGSTEGSMIEGSLTLTLSPARSTDTKIHGTLTGRFSFPKHYSQELGKDWLGVEPRSTP